jgi:hypothetical protein
MGAIAPNTALEVRYLGHSTPWPTDVTSDALQQLLIIERTPEPESSPLDGLTAEQKQQLEHFARYLKANISTNAPEK